MEIVRFLHSWGRWLLILVALVAVTKLIIGLAQQRRYDQVSQILMGTFSGLVGLEFLLGVILLISSGISFAQTRLAHIVPMVVAVALLRLQSRWTTAPAATRYRNNLFLIFGVLGVIIAGITLLPAGINWRLMVL